MAFDLDNTNRSAIPNWGSGNWITPMDTPRYRQGFSDRYGAPSDATYGALPDNVGWNKTNFSSNMAEITNGSSGNINDVWNKYLKNSSVNQYGSYNPIDMGPLQSLVIDKNFMNENYGNDWETKFNTIHNYAPGTYDAWGYLPNKPQDVTNFNNRSWIPQQQEDQGWMGLGEFGNFLKQWGPGLAQFAFTGSPWGLIGSGIGLATGNQALGTLASLGGGWLSSSLNAGAGGDLFFDDAGIGSDLSSGASLPDISGYTFGQVGDGVDWVDFGPESAAMTRAQIQAVNPNYSLEDIGGITALQNTTGDYNLISTLDPSQARSIVDSLRIPSGMEDFSGQSYAGWQGHNSGLAGGTGVSPSIGSYGTGVIPPVDNPILNTYDGPLLTEMGSEYLPGEAPWETGIPRIRNLSDVGTFLGVKNMFSQQGQGGIRWGDLAKAGVSLLDYPQQQKAMQEYKGLLDRIANQPDVLAPARNFGMAGLNNLQNNLMNDPNYRAHMQEAERGALRNMALRGQTGGGDFGSRVRTALMAAGAPYKQNLMNTYANLASLQGPNNSNALAAMAGPYAQMIRSSNAPLGAALKYGLSGLGMGGGEEGNIQKLVSDLMSRWG